MAHAYESSKEGTFDSMKTAYFRTIEYITSSNVYPQFRNCSTPYTLSSAIFQQNALSKVAPITGRTVRNLKNFEFHFCLIDIWLKKCAKFAPFLLKTTIEAPSM